MPRTRRVVRKITPAKSVTFDDQLWPINVALVVLSGFVAGIIVATSQFDDPRWLYNGWVRLFTLALSVGTLMWFATRLDARWMRRGFQLACVLSLLFHVLLAIVLHQQHIAYLSEREPETDLPQRTEVTLPEYHFTAEEQKLEEFEKPVETETPEETKSEVVRAETKPQETPTESQPTPVPGSSPQVQPNTVAMRQTTEAAPRRSQESSRLSKQAANTKPQPNEPIAAPQPRPETERTASNVEADVKPVERKTAETEAQRQPTPQEPKQTPRQQIIELARRETTEPTEKASSSTPTPTLTRQIKEAAAVPRVNAEKPQPVAETPAPATETLQPKTTVARQQSAAPAVAAQQSAEPKLAAAVEVARIDAPRQQAVDQPQPNRSPDSSPTRKTQEATLNAAAEPTPSAQAATTPIQATTPAPAAVQVARALSGGPAMPSATTDAAASTPAVQPSAAISTAVARAEQPSINPAASVSAPIARATRAASATASPVNLENPSAAQSASTTPSQPQAEPNRMAVSKGTSGIAGMGQEENFDRGLAATRSPAPTPSVSVSRATASQRDAPGPALSPSLPATIAKSTAGAMAPSTTIAVTVDAPNADAAGSHQPSTVEASSSAAVTRADAAAPRGAITAAAGSGEIDIGPTQILANTGAGRPAGGGAPEVRLTTQGSKVAKSGPSGGAAASISATAVAATPEAPAGQGGGAPSPRIEANSASTAATRGAAGGPAPASVGIAQMTESAAPSGGAIASTAIARAPSSAAVDAIAGAASKGGTTKPTRTIGAAIAADVKADAPQIAAGPDAGQAPVSPGASGGPAPSRSLAGLPGRNTGDIGAAAGPTLVDAPAVGSPGAGTGPRKAESTAEQGPTSAALAGAGPQRKSAAAGLPTGIAATVSVPNSPVSSAKQGEPKPNELASADIGGAVRRAGSLPVDVTAPAGPGGLGAEVAVDVGSLSRRAQRDSELVHVGTARFLNRKVGGPLAIDGKAKDAAEAFTGRSGRRQPNAGGAGEPVERTEAAVELGLEFLARHQSPDGSWSLNHFGAGQPGYENERAAIHSDTAATGLALLAFLGAGYDHFDDKYRNVVGGGIDYLRKNQKPTGDLYLSLDPTSNESAWLYSHAIATIALTEAYGMTGDETLREPAQKAIEFIVSAQHPKLGGWRYTPQFDTDTSVTGWQLMALKSGELAGLKVPKESYDKVRLWLDSAQGGTNGSGYVYNPRAKDTGTSEREHGRRTSPAMTSVGLLMRLYLGWNRDDQRMVQGADMLLENLPAIGNRERPTRDTYYWYYATQVMFHMKGKHWQAWNDRLHPLLVERQVQAGAMAGSWDPLGAVPDRWGPQAGRIYVTTLNLLSLEVNYRHLPIYESTGK